MGAGGARPSWCQHRGLRCAAEQGGGVGGRGGQAWENLQGHLALAVTVQARKESTWTREMSRNGRSGQMRDAEGRARGFRKRTQGVRVEDESGPAERRRPEAAAWNSGGRKCGVGGTAVWFAPIRSATSPRHPSRKAPRASETESGEGPQVAWVGPRGGSVAGRRPERGPRPGPQGVKEKGAAGDPRRPPVSCCRAEASETRPALTTVPATWRSRDPDRAVREPGRRMRQAGGAQGRKRVWGSATTGAREGRRCRGGLRKAASRSV